MVEKLFPNPFLKNQIWAHLCFNSLKFYTEFYVFFICQVKSYQDILKLSYRPTTFYLTCFFKKTERGLELVSLSHFLHDFWRITFFLLQSINWPNCIVWLPLRHEILCKMCMLIVCYPDQYYLSNLAAFSTWPKTQDKILNILRTKRAFKTK